MIICFPCIYEDELVYSILARYYQKTGYVAYRDVAEDLYVNPHTRPDTEFVNPLTSDAVSMLCRKKPMEQIVLEHTMFSYYARFLPIERKQEAFSWMVEMKGKCSDIVPMRVTKGKIRYLRYCPLCVKEHREQYGETYWTRVHQISDIRICIKHNVFLLDSIVEMTGNISPNLVPAEIVIPENGVVVQVNTNQKEYEISKFIQDSFLHPFDFTNATPMGKFLHGKLSGTQYLSKRGGAKRITELFNDITNFYSDLELCRIEKFWHLEQIFTGRRYYLSDIALLAYYLGISMDELMNPVMEVDDLTKQFDMQVMKLHSEGLNYMQIAKQLGASYDVVKAIGLGHYNQYYYERRKKKERTTFLDWETMDIELQADVRKVVEEIYGIGNVRPKRVTVHNVATALGIPNTRLKQLPKCVAIIKEKEESYEQYFAREVIWAAKIIMGESKQLNYTAISKLTNLRRKHFDACKPYLNKFTDKELAERIRQL